MRIDGKLIGRQYLLYHMNNNQGVAITWVDPKGALGKTGFEANDIILGIENQPIAVFGDNY
jgi:S1-C subfamily serine protease